ncbi:PREDICTED: extensin-2 isoform X1 [Bactrocera latifrons]|uniref:extensin-2 isoform X1 n=1 Tax=Bactrocera latifrons TaxID=174628 RepID=UPI0008DC9265|nr:PREDICTED: extensin-2 isoform X1 [Bactrocera latifrons]
MIFQLSIFVLTALTSSTLAQYNYEPPLKRGGYNYSPPEEPFNETPPSKSFSDLRVSTSAPKLVDKTSAPHLGYTYIKPDVLFTPPTPIKNSITAKPPSNFSGLPTRVPNLKGYEYARPAVSFTYPSINLKSNSTPVSSQIPKITLIPALKPKEAVLPPPFHLKSSGYTYPHPVIPFTIPKDGESHPSTVPTAHPTTDYSYNTSTPSIDVTSDPSISPIISTNTTYSPKIKGYTYTRPFVSFTIPARIRNDKPTQLPKLKGYFYPKPKEPLTLPNIFPKSKDNLETKQGIILKNETKAYTEISTDRSTSIMSQTSSKGYFYSPPEVPFTLPPKNSITRPSEVQITHSTNSSSTLTPKTSPLKRANGYVYSRPDTPFKTPTRLPISKAYTDRSTNIISETSSKGYLYSPPEVPFILPPKSSVTQTSEGQTNSSSKLISYPETSPLKRANGYVYSRPDTPFKTPTMSPIKISSSLPKSNGYLYIPPDITFNIPSSTPTTNRSPTKILGYSYKPPKVPFTTQKKTLKTDTPPSSILLKSQKQTKPVVNSNYLEPPQMGYIYPKPAIPFGF